MALTPGTEVGERYRLVRPLASGGMATVWVADDDDGGRVAIKFLSRDFAGQVEVRARFGREATAGLVSPYIVELRDHGVTGDDTPFLVMELLEGEDLGARLEREGAQPLDKVSTLVQQMAAALTTAHDAGIVHRDIKPDNIFMATQPGGEEVVKLLDFGIAKHTAIQSHSVVTATGTMMGTPGYMSPEQVLTGSKVDLRSDIWSAAVLVYHALTGEVPFDGATLGALCVAITRGEYIPPSERINRLPTAIDEWMERALELEPEDRFGSAQAMADAFVAATDGVAPEPSIRRSRESDTVHNAVTVMKQRKRAAGGRLWVIAAVALGAAALGGVVVAQFLDTGAPRVTPAAAPTGVALDEAPVPTTPSAAAATSSATHASSSNAAASATSLAAASSSASNSAAVLTPPPGGWRYPPKTPSSATAADSATPAPSASVKDRGF